MEHLVQQHRNLSSNLTCHTIPTKLNSPMHAIASSISPSFMFHFLIFTYRLLTHPKIFSKSFSYFFKDTFPFLKTRQQAPNGVTYAKPHITKPRLNCSFTSPGNGTLHQSIRNLLIRRSEEICPIDPCQSLKESYLAITNQHLPSRTFLLLLPSAYKSL